MIGDRPLVKLGGDLIAITSDGYIPLLQFLGAGREQRQLAISDKIAPTVTQAVSSFGSVAGWQAILFSEANWLLFNVPEDDGGSRFIQHTMNVQTGAWCSFRGMNARCWETYKGKLYYGTGAGLVMQADTGGADGATSIRGLVRSAYNYLQSPYDKQFQFAQGAYRERRCRFSGADRGERRLRPQLACIGSRHDHAGRNSVGYSRLGHLRVGVRAG